MPEFDKAVRLAAFNFLTEQTRIHGEMVPYAVLLKGFQFEGQRVPLLGPQGIFKPRVLTDYPLTFTTIPPNMHDPRPYDDELGSDGLISYKYMGTDPDNPVNVRLRNAMRDHIPLIYLFGMVPGKYRPVWPVYIVHDNPTTCTFGAMADDGMSVRQVAWAANEAFSEEKRRYITREVQHRLHQRSFRERVLLAYHTRCAVCRLRHAELLEAAHILPDTHPEGNPIIPNGVSLCKLHHAAYDQNILGIDSDYRIHIQEKILAEHDGPMLKHGIQEMDGTVIQVPRVAEFKPKREFLEIRFAEFGKAG